MKNMLSGICYLLLCHDNVEHLCSLVDSLSSTDSYFVVHVDKKSNCDFSALKQRKNVYMVEQRISVVWGSISVVDAVLSLSEYAIKVVPNAHYYCLLSGADYPVKSHDYIKHYLINHTGVDFIQGIRLPSPDIHWNENGRNRIASYAIPLNAHSIATIEPRVLSFSNLKQLIKVLITNHKQLPYSLKVLLSFPKRVVPYNMSLYAGELWWMLTNTTLRFVLQWNQKNPLYYKYHCDTQIPDEIYFNSIVWNYTSQIDSDIKRYISWIKKTDPSPKWMTIDEDCELVNDCIANPDILFIRKVRDKAILQMIESKLSQ